MLDSNTLNHFSVCQNEPCLVQRLLPTNYVYLIYLRKQDFILDYVEVSMCCKTQPTVYFLVFGVRYRDKNSTRGEIKFVFASFVNQSICYHFAIRKMRLSRDRKLRITYRRNLFVNNKMYGF